MAQTIKWDQPTQVKGGWNQRCTYIMKCGMVLQGEAIRPDKALAKNVAGNVLAEAIRVHLAKCKRRCNQ